MLASRPTPLTRSPANDPPLDNFQHARSALRPARDRCLHPHACLVVATQVLCASLLVALFANPLHAQLPTRDARDATRLYLASPPLVSLADETSSAAEPTLTADQADSLFADAQRLAEQGLEGPAYRLLFEVLAGAPEHADTLRVLGPTLRVLRPDDEPLRAVASRRPERTFGWGADEWRRVDSPHFTVIGSASSEELIAVARRIERLYLAWDQAFFEVWSPAGRLDRALGGSGSLSRTNGRKHTVVLFADRDEYRAKLRGVAPNIDASLGYYAPTRRQAMFFAGDEAQTAALLHEVTHQLFHERLGARGNAGDRSNFWLVEGIATVMESMEDHGDFLTIGGYDAERLQYARFNVFSGKVLIPFEDLVELGQDSFQTDPDVRKMYSQASGMASWLLIDESGERPQVLADLLRELYAGRDAPERLREGLGMSWDECVKQYVAYLRPLKSQVAGRPPRADTTCLAFCYGDIDDATLAALPKLEQLDWLDLTSAPISDRGLRELDRFPALRQLFLTGTATTDECLDEIARIESLEELDLSATRVSNAGLAKLARLPNLAVLHLNDTAIDDSAVETLARFPALNEIDLKGTRMTEAGAARLERLLSARRRD